MLIRRVRMTMRRAMKSSGFSSGCGSAARKAQQAARGAVLASPLFQEGVGFFVRIGRRIAIRDFAFGPIPEFLLAAFGPAGRFPKLVSASANFLHLIVGRAIHHAIPHLLFAHKRCGQRRGSWGEEPRDKVMSRNGRGPGTNPMPLAGIPAAKNAAGARH